MKPVLKGDPNDFGGKVIGPCSSTTTINNRPVSLVGDEVSPHKGKDGKDHIGARTQPYPGGPDYTIDNKKVTLVGSIDSCGCPRSIGSSDTGIG